MPAASAAATGRPRTAQHWSRLPFVHTRATRCGPLALAANVALVARDVGPRSLYVVTLVVQLAVLFAAGIGGVLHVRVLLVARYYVLTTASLAAGLWDWLRRGTPAVWEPAEGTR